jgi:hypothetical protein
MKSVIEKIHNEFNTAGEKLLTEAKTHLKKEISDKGVRLKKAGFSNTREAIDTERVIDEINKQTEVYNLVMHYQTNYPNNKFITGKQVESICNKYNLICGPTERYKGFVPEKNLKEIEGFNSSSEDDQSMQIKILSFEWEHSEKTQIDAFKREYPDGIVGEENLNRPYSFGKDIDVITSAGTARINSYEQINKDGLFICAPKKDFDLKGVKKFGTLFSTFTTKTYPDPVVLKPCKGGYLIVTAWGDEASDPEVVNEKMN